MQSPRKWWQDLVAGRLRTPQSIFRAGRDEALLGDDPVQNPRLFHEVPDDDYDRFEVPRRLMAPGWLKLRGEGYLAQHDLADWQYVDERLQCWAASFVLVARKKGLPLFVSCAFRGQVEQDEAHRRGRSKLVWPNSAHNRGAAVDIVHGVHAWDLSRLEWSYLAKLGREVLRRQNAGLPKERQLVLEWGGDWSFYDPAHWQIAGYDRLPVPRPSGPIHRTPDAIKAMFR